MTYPPQQQPPVTPGRTWPQAIAARQQPAAPPPPPPAKPSRLPWIIAVLAVLAAAGALAFAFLRGDDQDPTSTSTAAGAQTPDPQPFEARRDNCDPNFEGTTIGDRGKTLIIEGGQGLAPDAIGCMFTALGAPQSVIAQVEGTRALDGRQTATWPGFSASWTYHPDSGLDAIITATS